MPQPVTFRCDAARLITRASADRAGIGDWVVKRDFRRDADQEIRREGYDYFWPITEGAFAANPLGQPFPNNGATDEAITFIHHARRPNGRHAILAGTKTKLWRFFGNEDGDYAEDYYELVGSDAPYAGADSQQWMLIGSGFSENGHRWEAVDINGYTVLNNGVDLPMTYRVEDVEVLPIYELREQGIASVGTIGDTNGVLMCADISEIHTDEFLALMDHIGDIDSGDVTAKKEAGSDDVTTPTDFWEAEHVGRTIVWEDGTTRQILVVVDARTVEVDGNDVPGITSGRFTLRNTATQAGSEFSGLVSAGSSGTTITADDDFFDVGMEGKTIRFSNGFSATIETFLSTTQVEIDTSPDEDFEALPFWISEDAAYVLEADAEVFTEEMEGRYIIFDSGEVRQIVTVTNATTVVVDSDAPITDASFFRIENPDSYGAFTDSTKVDRVQYRTLWAMPDEPRRFGMIVGATMEEGSQEVVLKIPVKSLSAGDEIIIAGAGTSGGNLTATILSVSGLGNELLVSTPAVTAIEEEPLERSDAFGSIVGFEDLQDDSSAILRIQSLSDVLVIYKETCIFTAFFTGSTENPFRFTRLKLPKTVNLVYRWTLVDVGGQFHVYAGANAFYKFDLSSRVPQLVPELEMISDIFFTQAAIEDTEEIFGANSGVTNEIVFWFPSSSSEKAICLDYKTGSASTSGMEMTAAATVKRPGEPNEQVEDLFLMGNAQGTVLVYGRADATQASWGGEKEIFYRRSASPFSATKGTYSCTLETGWGDFGDPQNAKDMTGFVLFLASQSEDCPIVATIYGARNVRPSGSVANVTTWMTKEMVTPIDENMIPTFFRDYYYKTKLVVSDAEKPCRIAQIGYELSRPGFGSQNHERRSMT